MAPRTHRAAATLKPRRDSESGRGFSEDRALSFGDPESRNMLVVGDNARALAWLAEQHAGTIRAVYIDPPYNTGRTFAEYEDKKTTADWSRGVAAVLARARALLTDDGVLVAEIDDTELATLITLCDAAFGRAQRIATVTVKRSAATGHKAKNAGPVNVSDYLLFYAKDRKRVRMSPVLVPHAGVDPAYSTFLVNADAEPSAWRFSPLRTHVARSLGYGSVAAAKRTMGEPAWEAARVSFALENAARVVRFAEPRFEAVGRDVQRAILRSREEPSRVLLHERRAHKPFYLLRGQRILFLADKVQRVHGAPTMLSPLTTIWDDVPFQGIAKEGGVVFIRNKKPERLLHRILSMVTEPGDCVLDPYLGSGTTAAVAQKMGRTWIGVEAGAHAIDMARERLVRVVRGEDRTGMTRELDFRGGGGFRVFR